MKFLIFMYLCSQVPGNACKLFKPEYTEFKTYMRVKTKDGKIIGEIENIYDNKLLVSYTDGSNTGWNSQNDYKKMELSINDVEKLDNGLNSPWIYNF